MSKDDDTDLMLGMLMRPGAVRNTARAEAECSRIGAVSPTPSPLQLWKVFREHEVHARSSPAVQSDPKEYTHRVAEALARCLLDFSDAHDGL